MVPAASGLTERREKPGRDFGLLSGRIETNAPAQLHRVRKPLNREEWKRQHIDQIKRPTGGIVDPRASPGPLPPMSAVSRPCSSSLIPQKLPKNCRKEHHSGGSI
jgi:hypothetical protein